jgi:hypothetical protein
VRMSRGMRSGRTVDPAGGGTVRRGTTGISASAAPESGAQEGRNSDAKRSANAGSISQSGSGCRALMAASRPCPIAPPNLRVLAWLSTVFSGSPRPALAATSPSVLTCGTDSERWRCNWLGVVTCSLLPGCHPSVAHPLLAVKDRVPRCP